MPPYLRSRQAAAFLAHTTPQDISPFRNTPESERNREYLWLKPEIVVEVSFHEWTPRGELPGSKISCAASRQAGARGDCRACHRPRSLVLDKGARRDRRPCHGCW
ncbi:hypothetical protein GCT13_42385 [Paraburkholderia sp. CNPSo 3157]|uniref:DNA ligase (ATP) n=1 Tax=Paraburkholderia franconis TaxID=2654983 RepID=A0A7X1NJU5_9BURK|nr:hypothetical protein [Paraburkholderia franconis]